MSTRAQILQMSELAVDLTAEVGRQVAGSVAKACGARGSIVNYIVGVAFLSVGARVMRHYCAEAAESNSELLAEGVPPREAARERALDLVRGIFEE